MEAERNLAIERENKILLGKMYSIMNAEPAYKTHKARPTQTMFTFMCAPSMFARLCSLPCSLSQVTVTSLNMNVRKQEYDRIARENQARTASRPSSSLGPPRPRPLPGPGVLSACRPSNCTLSYAPLHRRRSCSAFCKETPTSTPLSSTRTGR